MYKERLILLRKEKNWTQKDMAELINIHRGRYNQYETELDIIPIEHLNTICNFFNVSLDYVFGFVNASNYGENNYVIDKKLAGRHLKDFRKNEHITQKQLGEIPNVNQSVIAKYENGINLIPTAFLYAICDIFGVSADYLLGRVNGPMYWDKKKK